MILIYSGLPASGKTTKALEWVAEDPQNRLRINYDDLRVELFGCKGGKYFAEKQKVIRERELAIKSEALQRATRWFLANSECYCDENQGAGYTYSDEHGDCDMCLGKGTRHSVVIDNTNLTDSARRPWEQLGQLYGIEVVHEEMTTPVWECVERDRLRTGDDRVGQAVIDRMALTTGWIDWDDHSFRSTEGKDFVIVDIDGTLSDPSYRLHYIKSSGGAGCQRESCKHVACICGKDPLLFKPRWDKFRAEVDKDPPMPAIVQLVHSLSFDYYIIIVSGRSPEHGCGIKTEDWLLEHLGDLRYLHLFMRAAGDYRPDYEHKQQILDLLPKDRIAFVLDDRDQVVQMWRRNGLTCLQVAPGAF